MILASTTEVLIFFLLVSFPEHAVRVLDFLPRDVQQFLLGSKRQWLGLLKNDFQTYLWFFWYSLLLPLIMSIFASIEAQKYFREPSNALEKASLSKQSRLRYYAFRWYGLIVDISVLAAVGASLNIVVSESFRLLMPAIIAVVVGSWFVAAVASLVVAALKGHPLGAIVAILVSEGAIFSFPNLPLIWLLRYGCLYTTLHLSEYFLSYVMSEGLHLLTTLLRLQAPRVPSTHQG